MEPEDQQPKITLASFFQSFKEIGNLSADTRKLVLGLEKTVSSTSKNVDVNKSEIKKLERSVETIEQDVDQLTDIIQAEQERKSRELDQREDEVFKKEDELQKKEKGITGKIREQLEKGLAAAGGATVSGAVPLALMGLTRFSRSNLFTDAGGIIDAATGDLTDLDQRGRPDGGTTGTTKNILSTIDFFTGNFFGKDLDRKGKLFGEKRKLTGKSYKDGGEVEETGLANVHEGEFIINKESADKLGENLLASLNDDKSKKKYNLKPLLDMIGSGESDSVGGYTAMYPNESYPEILDMTINELIEFQREKLKDGRVSAAVGRYQMLYPEDYAAAAKFPLTTKFTPENQDKMVIEYLKQERKLNEFLRGEITNEQFSEQLAREYGTFKSASGYVLPNNSGSINFQMMLPVLNKIKQKIEPTKTKERSLISKFLGVLDAITGDRFDFDNLGREVSPDKADSNRDYSINLAQNFDSGGANQNIEVLPEIVIDNSRRETNSSSGSPSVGDTPPPDVGGAELLNTKSPIAIIQIMENDNNLVNV